MIIYGGMTIYGDCAPMAIYAKDQGKNGLRVSHA
jgi:hypothetical protein